MSDLAERLRENIERVEWTLQDAGWQPSREYVEKMLAACREAADEIERLRRELNLLRVVHESAEAEVRQLLDENGSLIAVCREFIDRWPTEQGIDNTIQRARAILLDHDLRSPPEDAVNRVLVSK